MKITALLTSKIFVALLVTGVAVEAHAGTVMGTISQTPNLSTAAKLIQQAGLSETLEGMGPFTVFVPNNAAFNALSHSKLTEIASNKELLKQVLSYHMVPARITLDNVVNGSQKTTSGASLVVYKAGTFLTVDNAVVVQADLKASNGVVQEIDTVLMPNGK